MNKINYSFIIPHRNSPELLNRCLNTIPEREDIEIIVVDDNSDDGKKPRVNRNDVQTIFIDSEHSKGAGRARNVGMEKAKGKWLLFADCDDFYEKGFIDELDKYIDSDFDLVIFDAYLFFDIENKTCETDIYKLYIENYLSNPGSEYHQMMVKLGNYATWMRMYSHSFINKLGVRFDEVPSCNDGWFVQYVGVKARSFTVIPHKLYYYVVNKESITTKIQPKSVVMLDRRTNYKIHKFLARNNLYYAIRPYFHGIRGIYKKYGIFFTLKVLLDGFCHDVSPFKYFFYKYINKKR